MKGNFKLLPYYIILQIQSQLYHSIHYVNHKIMLLEYDSYILDKGDDWDMGYTILARIDGMPLLEELS